MEDKIINKIISVAYNDASWIDKIKIYSLSKSNPEVKKLLEDYKANSKIVKHIKVENCPEALIERTSKLTKATVVKEKSLVYDIYCLLFGRPIIAVSILTIIIAAIISTFLFNQPETQQNYTPQEIILAEAQTKHSLSIVTSVFKKTKRTVEDDVLTNRVSKPIKQTFILVNEFFLGENKNENIN